MEPREQEPRTPVLPSDPWRPDCSSKTYIQLLYQESDFREAPMSPGVITSIYNRGAAGGTSVQNTVYPQVKTGVTSLLIVTVKTTKNGFLYTLLGQGPGSSWSDLSGVTPGWPPAEVFLYPIGRRVGRYLSHLESPFKASVNSISVLVFVRLEHHVLFRSQSLKTNEGRVDILNDRRRRRGDCLFASLGRRDSRPIHNL